MPTHPSTTEDSPAPDLPPDDLLCVLADLGEEGRELADILDEIVQQRRHRPPRPVPFP